MKQRSGPVHVEVNDRNDITVLEVPDEMKGLTKASTLRDVEKETGTFCFFQGDNSTSNALLVCGHREEDRAKAQHILQDILVRGATRPKPRREWKSNADDTRPQYRSRPDTRPHARAAGGRAGVSFARSSSLALYRASRSALFLASHS